MYTHSPSHFFSTPLVTAATRGSTIQQVTHNHPHCLLNALYTHMVSRVLRCAVPCYYAVQFEVG